MNEILDFAKDNIMITIIICLFVILLLIAFVFALMRRKKESADTAKFEEGIERFDQRYMKKCKHCGASVPIDDNICMSCGEIPN